MQTGKVCFTQRVGNFNKIQFIQIMTWLGESLSSSTHIQTHTHTHLHVVPSTGWTDWFDWPCFSTENADLSYAHMP